MRMPGTSDTAAMILAARRALASGDVAGAEALCKTLIERAPRHSEPFALLAETALLRGRGDAALACAERAVALAPRDAIARIMLAKTRLHQGDLAEALQAAEAAHALIGGAPDAADALAALYGLLGRHARALELSRRAVASAPDNAQFLFNLAATQRMLGRLAEAEANCDRLIARDPRYALAHYVRADLRVQSAERNHIAEMEALLAKGGLDWRAETLLRYALAKECEDIGDDARAFAHVETGARLWRGHAAYDAKAEIAGIDRVIASQTRNVLAAARSDAEDAPVFVCGLPRTGTTLVERLLASHSALDAAGETNLFAIEAARALRAAAGGPPDFDALGRRYMAATRSAFAPRRPRFVDKTLTNALYCGMIHAALPQARIILVERGPMACAWSLYKAHFRSGFLYSYDLVELADHYCAYRRLVAHWKETLPQTALTTVRYEDVVRNARGESARLLAFLGLPFEEETLRFHESRAPSATASAVQVRRPIYASSLAKWRAHEAALAPFRSRLAANGVDAGGRDADGA